MPYLFNNSSTGRILRFSIFSIIIFCFGCFPSRRLQAARPFVIVEKEYVYTDPKVAEYKIVDSNGIRFVFYDNSNLHNVGDTIR
jgi:hypothetical protein